MHDDHYKHQSAQKCAIDWRERCEYIKFGNSKWELQYFAVLSWYLHVRGFAPLWRGTLFVVHFQVAVSDLVFGAKWATAWYYSALAHLCLPSVTSSQLHTAEPPISVFGSLHWLPWGQWFLPADNVLLTSFLSYFLAANIRKQLPVYKFDIVQCQPQFCVILFLYHKLYFFCISSYKNFLIS